MAINKIKNEIAKNPIRIISDGTTSMTLGTVADRALLQRVGTTAVGWAPAFGEMYVLSGSEASQNADAIWQNLSGTTSADIMTAFSMSANNRLIYTGSATAIFQANCTMTVEADVQELEIDLALAQSGSVHSSSWARGYFSGSEGATDDALHLSTNCFLRLATDEYVEPQIKCNSAATLTASFVNLTLTRVW